VWFLEQIDFSWVSVIIFLFFLAFASYFIIKIRRTAKEWVVIEKRENIVGFMIDFFSVPIVATGKWLSGKFARLNVFAFVLDFIIEAPFKVFVEIAEQWTRYVKERKEEL
jgi:riboflavin transporter FmnP